MRRGLTVSGVALGLGAAYWAWPFVGAEQLASAAQRGSSAEVIERVDLPALRRSLSRQIASAYLKASGKSQKLGSFGLSLAGAAVTTVADPYVAQLLTPESITALIGQGKIGTVKLDNREVAVNRDLPNVSNLFRSDVVSSLTGSYFDGIRSFVIPIGGQVGADNDYAIHMRLNGLTWRLSGIDLPPTVVDDMARAILHIGEQPPAP